MKVKILLFLDDGGQNILREETHLASGAALNLASHWFNMLLQQGIKEALPFPMDKLAIQIAPEEIP